MFEKEDTLSLTAIQWFNKGYDYDVKEDYENAVFAYTKAIELNPKDADAYINRGVIYHTQGKYDLAIADYTKAIEFNPQDEDGYSNRGAVYHGQGEYSLAIGDYDKALELNPKAVDVYVSKLEACEESGLHTHSHIEKIKQNIKELGGSF